MQISSSSNCNALLSGLFLINAHGDIVLRLLDKSFLDLGNSQLVTILAFQW